MTGTRELVLIAAQARNRVIGDDNRLLWRLKTDLRRFRSLSLGKPIIMGRKTFDSIGKPLPGRRTIVMTRNSAWRAQDVLVAMTVDDALDLAQEAAQAMGADQICVAGGGEVYRLFLPLAARLEITDVNLAPAGDSTFPEIDPAVWRLSAEQNFTKSADDEAEFSFRTYLRR
ncbi:FolA Dihydrofolate reductase [Rhabdaerophilaceae bacterium]